MQGELFKTSSAQKPFQVKFSNQNRQRILDYLVQFENKLAKRNYTVPPAIASSPIEWSSLIYLIDQFIRQHTYTVWYEVLGDKSSVTLAGYVGVISMIEQKVLKRFRSETVPTKKVNSAPIGNVKIK